MSAAVRTLNCIKDFRHAVVDSLKAAELSGIGSNVSASREMKAWPEEESFIIVNVPDIDFDDKNTSPRFYFCKSELRIDIYSRCFLSGENNVEGVASADRARRRNHLQRMRNSLPSALIPSRTGSSTCWVTTILVRGTAIFRKRMSTMPNTSSSLRPK